MASALNKTWHSEESIRRNPAAVLGGGSLFFGTDSSAWAAEIFFTVSGGVALPMATPWELFPPPTACSFGVVQFEN